MNNSQKKYDFFIYALIMFSGIILTSWFEPLIGEKVASAIQIVLFCICMPITLWMRWQNRKIDKQNKDN